MLTLKQTGIKIGRDRVVWFCFASFVSFLTYLFVHFGNIIDT